MPAKASDARKPAASRFIDREAVFSIVGVYGRSPKKGGMVRAAEAIMAGRRLILRDTSRFKDPAGLTWDRYVALQARERERYQAERATLPAEALEFRTVSPRYLERAIEQFANNY